MPLVGYYCVPNPVPCFPFMNKPVALIWPYHGRDVGCDDVQRVTERGRLIATYTDDSLGIPLQTAAMDCEHARHTWIWEGQVLPRFENGLTEWYPILNQSSPVGYPLTFGSAGGGYFLQVFNWQNVGDPVHTALCTRAGGCTYPSVRQERLMWCRALARHPRVIFFFGDESPHSFWLARQVQHPCLAPGL